MANNIGFTCCADGSRITFAVRQSGDLSIVVEGESIGRLWSNVSTSIDRDQITAMRDFLIAYTSSEDFNNGQTPHDH